MSQAVVAEELLTRSAYQHAVDRLYALGQELAPLPPLPDGTPAPRRKWDLDYMRTLCAALAQDGVAPQNTFPSVLFAGTNGKGSTAATLAGILAAAGYKTGLYTSPHLVRVNERIQILPPALEVSGLEESRHPERSEGSRRTTASPSPLEPFSHNSPGAPSIAPSSPTIQSLALSGTYTSPEIPDHTFARLFAQVEDTATALVSSGTLPHPPSFFEVLTALAFLYFSEEKVDIAVLEVGLGGRLDATNIVDPLISVITDIALDHQEYLGNTIAAIALEKAGILRPNGILVTLPQHPEANQAIGEAAATLNLTAISAADFIPQQTPSNSATHTARVPHPSQLHRDGWDVGGQGRTADNGQRTTSLPRNHYTLTLDNQPLEVDSPLPGHHQQRNIALAIATATTLRNLSSYKRRISNQNSYNIPNAAIEAGIRNTRWPGRLEFLPPNLLLDVAHNPAGAWTLRAAIAQLPESAPRTLIFSCLSDKNLTEISRILFPLFDSSADRPLDHILLAPIANPRAAKVEDLLAAAHALDIPAHAAPHLEAALAQARAVTPPGGLIIATGSVYLVGAIRDLALSQNEPASADSESRV